MGVGIPGTEKYRILHFRYSVNCVYPAEPQSLFFVHAMRWILCSAVSTGILEVHSICAQSSGFETRRFSRRVLGSCILDYAAFRAFGGYPLYPEMLNIFGRHDAGYPDCFVLVFSAAGIRPGIQGCIVSRYLLRLSSKEPTVIVGTVVSLHVSRADGIQAVV